MENINKPFLIWLDANIDNEENKGYRTINKEKLKEFEVLTYSETEKAIEKLKTIFFKKTYQIISGRLYEEFIIKYKNNLNQFNVTPKITVFTGSVEGFKKKNEHIKEIYENPFYISGGIQISFDHVLSYILSDNNKGKNELFKNKKGKFKFEQIDSYEKLILPLYYKSLMKIDNNEKINKFNQYLLEKSHNNKFLFDLIEQINSLNNCPPQILCKFYAKAYTVDKDFCYEMNKELYDGNVDTFLYFIYVLFEGIKLNSFPIEITDNLYHGTKLSLDKLNELKNNLNIKKDDFPISIMYSKSFISFTKDVMIAEKNIKNQINDEIPIIFVIEKKQNMNYDFATHFNIESLSYFPNEREVVFLPFSSFEILEIKESDGIYFISLNPIIEYESKISEKVDQINSNNLICSSLFKEEFNLIPKDLINSMTYKQLFEKLKDYQNEIISTFDITKKQIGKPIQILNCYEEVKKRFSDINGENNLNELKEKCSIYINNKLIAFT